MANVKAQYVDMSRRSNEREWLDRDDLDPVELEKTLRDLAKFNQMFFGHYPVLRWLSRAMASAHRAAPLTIVDVGCGYGDLLRAIRRWSRRRNMNPKLLGLDLNPQTIRIARAASDPSEEIEFRVMNAFDFVKTTRCDLIVSSLLMHHLSNREIEDFLALMENSAHRGWLIYDLQRHWFLHRFIGAVGRSAGLHPIVVSDGQISVTRSLTHAEWTERISDAGIKPRDVAIRWFFFRYSIERLR